MVTGGCAGSEHYDSKDARPWQVPTLCQTAGQQERREAEQDSRGRYRKTWPSSARALGDIDTFSNLLIHRSVEGRGSTLRGRCLSSAELASHPRRCVLTWPLVHRSSCGSSDQNGNLLDIRDAVRATDETSKACWSSIHNLSERRTSCLIDDSYAGRHTSIRRARIDGGCRI